MTAAIAENRTRRPDGPNAGVLAIVSLVLALAAVIVSAIVAGGEFTVSPLSSTAVVAQYYRENSAAATLSGFFTFASGVPLGIYAATVYARMLKLGVRVPGPGIAFYGGICASIMAGLAGLVGWVLGQPISGLGPALIHALSYLTYAIGGVGFVGGIGLLVAGIAVPSLILRFVPSWLAWSGLVIAAISELSFFSLLWSPASVALPLGRFLGLVWLAAVAFLLPRTRHESPASHAR